MRKFLTVTLALVLVLGLCGLALAAPVNYGDVIQTSPDDFLDLDQDGFGNYVWLRQTANTENDATVNQIGSNNNVRLMQIANWDNDATINQNGSDNWLGYADCIGTISKNTYAYQESFWRRNELNLTVTGSNNQVGLRQKGGYYNLADITQTGSGNRLAAYQDNVNGFNKLDVLQTGNARAEICQKASSGDNNVKVIQQ